MTVNQAGGSASGGEDMAEESGPCGGRLRAVAQQGDRETPQHVAGRAGKSLRRRCQFHDGGGSVEEGEEAVRH